MTFCERRAAFFHAEEGRTSHKSQDYLSTAELRAFEAKRLAANQRDGLRLNFADVPCGLFALHELFRCGVPEDNVGLCSGTHKPTYVVSAVM